LFIVQMICATYKNTIKKFIVPMVKHVVRSPRCTLCFKSVC